MRPLAGVRCQVGIVAVVVVSVEFARAKRCNCASTVIRKESANAFNELLGRFLAAKQEVVIAV